MRTATCKAHKSPHVLSQMIVDGNAIIPPRAILHLDRN
jgi:hypothetical protein